MAESPADRQHLLSESTLACVGAALVIVHAAASIAAGITHLAALAATKLAEAAEVVEARTGELEKTARER